MTGLIVGIRRPNTVIKSAPVENSKTLSPDEKFDLMRGQTLEVKDVRRAEGDHYRIELVSSQKGSVVWYAYAPDVRWISDRRDSRFVSAELGSELEEVLADA
ncbi:MAG: hypothetical protein NW224_23565 [Leptolyngbyaceae cyanobacterium bins.302]|nr:hypothetical protein [Leptolyngbyaceae cyanobacterium bins.302]